ncbi:hypothetical protein ABBQ38_014836 [Trebouxia sp. C0009 RCD-2024]
MEGGMPRQADPTGTASRRPQQVGTTGAQGGSQGTGRKRHELGGYADDDDAPTQSAVDEDNAAEREDPQVDAEEKQLPRHESMAWEVVKMLAATANRPTCLRVTQHLEHKFDISLGDSQDVILGVLSKVQEACDRGGASRH